jgi:hypothetical protein
MKQSWSILRFIAIAVIGILGLSSAFAQSTNSGDIRGTVTDSTGALLPGATVTVTNNNTGVTKVLTTNDAGLYDTSSIVVGNYKLVFEHPGFEKFERSSITLEVGTSTVNAQLKVGSTSQSVVVNTDIPLLTTESGSQSTTLEAKSMAVLPNVGQDWENFAILIPGSSGVPGGSQGSTNPGQEISANGNLPYSNVLADGSTTTLSHSANSDVSVFETVAELQIQTSSFSAQYGIGGIIFNQISKGGTSQFHGSAYEYLENDDFDALPYAFYGNPTTFVPLRYDNFGGSIGGPILKHKAFFFFNYDQIVNKESSSGYGSIPTTQVMAGQFTAPNMGLIYDPTTQVIAHDPSGNPYPVRQSFLSEYGSNAIPAALQDPVALKFQMFYPTPTNHIPGGTFLPGTTTPQGIVQNNFFARVPGGNPFRKYFGRLDYDITQHNRLTASVTTRDNPAFFPSTVSACPIGCQNGDVESYNSQVSDVWTISPNIVNEARMGYTYQGNFYTDDALGKGYAAKLGFTAAKADDFPAIQFVTNYPYSWIDPSANAVYKEHVFDPSDVVTMIRGKHVLHFGGELQFFRDDSTAWGNTNAGTYQFSGQYTAQWQINNGVASPNVGSTGADYADFLLGEAQNWSASVSPEYGARLKSPQMFIQDDWKIRPNLTLNIGLRYQIRHGWSEVHGNEAVFDPTVNNPATNTLGAYWFGVTHANGRKALEDTTFSTVLPRVGFSWLPDPTMTIRGGFGLYAYNLSLDTYGGGMGAAISSSGSLSDQTNGIEPITILSSAAINYQTGQPLPYTSASYDPTRFNGQNVTYTQYHTPDPKIYQWNLSAQKQIGQNMEIEMAYVASHGFDLNFPTDLNQIPQADLSPNDAAFRPYPNYGSIGGSSNNAISNYNSLQVTVQRRLAAGLEFNFNYTWSHFLDSADSSGWGSRAGPQNYQIAYNPGANYSNSNFDVRNAFKGNIVYQLPFGRGKQFMNKSFILDELLGGYQISSTIQLTGGQPFSVFAVDANSYSQAGSVFPNYSGISTRPKGGRTIEEWYNPAAFTLPANGTYGDVRRNSLYGPGVELVNISAGKVFDIYKSVKLQIRADATNAFNHLNPGEPNGNLSNFSGQAAGTPFLEDTFRGQQIDSVQGGSRVIQLGARLQF